MRILLIEGQATLAKAFDALLRGEGYSVECADTGADALDLLRHYSFDLVLLNLNVRDVEGSALISRIRAAGHHTPLVAMVGLPNPKGRVAALAAGADDVVEHQTDKAELLARMRAIIRRSRGYSQPVIRVGALALDLEQQAVTACDKPVHLTSKEFALLRLLTFRKNTVLTKEAILSSLYGGLDEPEMKIVDVFICKIRSKLAKAGLRDIITTVWGRGYSINDNGRDRTAELPLRRQPNEAGCSVLAFA
jgi:two-component system cell cycle response regulator CtrA